MSTDYYNCPFCPMFEKPENKDAQLIDIEPLNPVVPGHRIIIPREHVKDFSTDPSITARVMEYAARKVQEMGGAKCFNIITSKGFEATQSVWHLHVHLVPRHLDDGLKLPWTDQVDS